MQIRTASVDEARRCATIVATALLHDPVGVRAVRTRHDRLRRMTGLYEAELRLGAFEHGCVDVAIVDGEIVGVAAWVRPDPSRMLGSTLRQAPRYVHAIGIAHMVSAIRALRRRRRARPDDSHWLLADIAVADAARGAGVGAALLQRGLARIDGPTYLEATTPASERLYARFGFEPRSRIGLTSAGYPVGMWRTARPGTATR